MNNVFLISKNKKLKIKIKKNELNTK